MDTHPCNICFLLYIIIDVTLSPYPGIRVQIDAEQDHVGTVLSFILNK